jgi:hypothetical protein
MEALMTADSYADNLEEAVRYALSTTHAIALCAFHPDVTIRVGDDAAETHACIRAKNIIRSDGTKWKRESLMEEMAPPACRCGRRRVSSVCTREGFSCVGQRPLDLYWPCARAD